MPLTSAANADKSSGNLANKSSLKLGLKGCFFKTPATAVINSEVLEKKSKS